MRAQLLLSLKIPIVIKCRDVDANNEEEIYVKKTNMDIVVCARDLATRDSAVDK